MMFVINSRTVGKLTVSSKTGELHKHPFDASVALPVTTRIIRRKSKAPEQPLAVLVAKKSIQAAQSASQAKSSNKGKRKTFSHFNK